MQKRMATTQIWWKCSHDKNMRLYTTQNQCILTRRLDYSNGGYTGTSDVVHIVFYKLSGV